MQEVFLLFSILGGLYYTGYLVAVQLFQKFSTFVNNQPKVELLFWVITTIFTIIMVEVFFLLISILPLKNSFLSTISSRHGKEIEDHQYPFKKYTLLISLAVTVVFFSLFFVFSRIGSDADDDIAMVQIVSGYFSNAPLEFPFFSSVLLGFLYRFLFSLNGNINWVILFYLFVNFLSVWDLIHNLLLIKVSVFQKITAILFILLIDCYLLNNLTFTTIASLACIAGAGAVISSLYSNHIPRIQRVFGIGLILIGSLIRFESAYLVLIMFSPLIIINIKNFISTKTIFTMAILIALIFSTYIFDQTYINTHSGWNEYFRYKGLHSELLDTPRKINIIKNTSKLDAIGWSKNDAYLFINWFSLDQQVYSETKMKYLVENIPTWNKNPDKINKLLGHYFFAHPLIDILFLSISCWIFMILLSSKKRVLITSLATAILLSLIMLLFTLKYKIPMHVSASLLITFSCITLFLPHLFETDANTNLEMKPTNLLHKGGILIAILFCCFAWKLFTRPFEQNKIIDAQNRSYQMFLQEINNQFNNGLFSNEDLLLDPRGAFPFAMMNPLSMEYPKVDILVGGWISFSPVYESEFKTKGMSSNAKTFVDQDNLFIISKSSIIPYVIVFYEEHYGIKVRCNVVYKFHESPQGYSGNNSVVIYKIEKSED
jgi:hypothetical protein